MTTILHAFERRIRNPSIKLVAGTLVVLLVITFGILGPTVIKDGIDNYNEIQRIQSFEFADPIETWIRPWMVQHAETMIAADQPQEWRPHNFVFGPCSVDNLRQLPTLELRDVIDYSCGELSRIQLDYSGECADTNSCSVSDEAKNEIRAVVTRLDEVFGELGLVLPYTADEQPSE